MTEGEKVSKMRSPKESVDLLLDYIGGSEGVTLEEIYTYAENDGLWFGVGFGVVDVILAKQDLDQIDIDPKTLKYSLARIP